MTLTREGYTQRIGGRAVALCVALVEGKVEVTDKNDLIKAAWPNSYVEAANLSVQLSALRKALGINSDGTAWIVTVPRHGYRLDADDGR
jgi:DNA-binding winged helix-turn-helix (wHTH) protein